MIQNSKIARKVEVAKKYKIDYGYGVPFPYQVAVESKLRTLNYAFQIAGIK